MRKAFLLLVIICTLLIDMKAQPKEYVLATYTYATNNRLQSLEPLAALLTETTGLKFKAVSYPSVESLISAIINDSIDFAMMNTSGYMILQRNTPGVVTPLVNLDMGNATSTNYGGCLIASKQSKISSIKDIHKQSNLSLALVNASSTSGNLVPRLLLNANNISDPESVLRVGYSGTHKKVVDDVLSGKADLGGCGCSEIDSARNIAMFQSKAVVIDSFNNIPLGPIVYQSRLHTEVVRSVSDQLLSLHKNAPAVFTAFCNGWTEFKQAVSFKTVTDDEYNAFRAMFGDNTKLWKLIE